MPRRQNRRRVETLSVQGDDSYVVVSLPHVSEIEEVMEQSGDNLESFKAGSMIIAKHVHEWNWVDDDGGDLPLPNSGNDNVGLLTTEEFKLLIELMLGSTEQKKK